MIFDGAGAAMALSDVCAGRGRNEGRREGGVKRDRPMYLEKGVPKIWGEVVFVCLHSRGPYKEGEREGGREKGRKGRWGSEWKLSYPLHSVWAMQAMQASLPFTINRCDHIIAPMASSPVIREHSPDPQSRSSAPPSLPHSLQGR